MMKTTSSNADASGIVAADEADPAFIDSTVVEAGAKPAFHLGGQALVEGVMMRSPHYVAAAVRRADGTIETRVEEFHSILQRHRWMQLPLVRGSIALIEMMIVGTQFLNWSGQVAMQTSTHDSSAQDAAPQDAVAPSSAATLQNIASQTASREASQAPRA